VVRTGGDGIHIYYTVPDDFQCAGQFILKKEYEIPGVEVKSGNGYVIIPGSMHYSGKMYEWQGERSIADGLKVAPDALLERVQKRDVEVLTVGIDTATHDPAELERARVLVAKYEGAGSGERNEQMFKLSAALLDYGLDEATAHEHLAIANLSNHPPLGQTEIHDIYKKATKYRQSAFGAKTAEAAFEPIDTSVQFDGQHLSAEEAVTQLAEITGSKEAIDAARLLAEYHAQAKETDDWSEFDSNEDRILGLIAHASGGTIKGCRRILSGRGGVYSAAEFDLKMKHHTQSNSEDLPEVIGMSVIASQFGADRIRFSHDKYWAYNPNMWHQISEQELRDGILTECNNLKTENPELGFSNNSVMQAADNLMRARTNVRPENFFPHADRPPLRIFNCLNGELWVNDDGTVELKESNPASRFFHSLDVNWNPEAKAPLYERVLSEVFQKAIETKEVVRHHLELKGYTLCPRKSVPVIEICIGSGANGKTLLNHQLMVAIAGTNTIGSGSLVNFRTENIHGTAALENKLVWVDPDLDASKPLPASTLKANSENMMLTINPKGRETREIMTLCSWCLLSNQLPHSKDISRGLERRVYLFEYHYDFEATGEDDHDLFGKLIAEKEGVFRLWVEGLCRMVRRGDRFDVPQELQVAKREWTSTQNIIASFVRTCLEIGVPGHEVYTREAYDAFREFCGVMGAADFIIDRRNFTNQLQSVAGIKTQRGTSNQVKFVGVKLLPMLTDVTGEVSKLGKAGGEPGEVTDWLV
jgi:P4 family phage/plasmid primase-like protien